MNMFTYRFASKDSNDYRGIDDEKISRDIVLEKKLSLV